MNGWKQLLFHFKLAELLFLKEIHIGKEIRESRDDYEEKQQAAANPVDCRHVPLVTQLFVK